MLIKLPREIWVQIFGYLDFKSLQCNATRVCKTWFEIIRNDSELSSELTLSLESGSDINSVLASWKKLKILRFKKLYRKTILQPEMFEEHVERWKPNDLREVNLKDCKFLEKVFVMHDFPGTKHFLNDSFG